MKLGFYKKSVLITGVSLQLVFGAQLSPQAVQGTLPPTIQAFAPVLRPGQLCGGPSRSSPRLPAGGNVGSLFNDFVSSWPEDISQLSSHGSCFLFLWLLLAYFYPTQGTHHKTHSVLN